MTVAGHVAALKKSVAEIPFEVVAILMRNFLQQVTSVAGPVGFPSGVGKLKVGSGFCIAGVL